MIKPQHILDFYLNVGILMQSNGASSYELFLALSSLAAKHNLPHAELLLFPNLIHICIEVDGVFYTASRRFTSKAPNMGCLRRLEEFLSEKKTQSALEDSRDLNKNTAFPHSHFFIALLACVVQCVATCRFFGGDVAACFATLWSSMVSYLFVMYFSKNHMNWVLQHGFVALFSGGVACGIGAVTGTHTPLPLYAATIIWLIPGVVMMNAFSDLFHGFLVAAWHRFAQAVIIVFALLLGLSPFLMIMIPPDQFVVSSAISPKIDWLWAGIASLGCAVRFEARGQLLFWGFVLGALGHGSRAQMIINLGMDVTTATFFAALLVGIVVAALFAHGRLRLVLVYMVSLGIIPLVPGAALLKAVYGVLQIATAQHPMVSNDAILQTCVVTTMALFQVGGLALGGILPTTLLNWLMRYRWNIKASSPF